MLVPNWLAMTLKTSPAEPKSLDKKQISIEEIVKSVKSVGDDIEQIIKLTSEEKLLVTKFRPLKKIAQDKKRVEVTEKLNAAKERLALAAQNSGVEQKKIHDEYEKKKQATIKKMHKLEKKIASKKTDGSLEARQVATNALANAVKSLFTKQHS